MAAEFKRLAYEAALRSLDKQEAYVEELRGRAGVFLAASSLAASLLGQQALQGPNPPALVTVALLAFVVSIGTEIFILLPKQGLIFMQKFWKENDAKIQWLIRAFTLAAAALVIEILALAVLLGGNLLSP